MPWASRRPGRASPRAAAMGALMLLAAATSLLSASAAAADGDATAAAAAAAAATPVVAHSTGGKGSCAKTVVVDPVAAAAPLAGDGEKCGPFLAVCKPGLCCGQTGFCGADESACSTLCQCSFSGSGTTSGGGHKSKSNNSPQCKGRYPPALPKTLPTASGAGAVCGAYVARCPRGFCCTEQSICAPATNAYCLSAGCQPVASGLDGGVCSASAALAPRRVVEKTLVLGWTEAAPDGYARQWISVNGKFPAENLVVDVGDRLIITLVNGLGIPTALHSHGFVQRRTAGNDGVATVTQRPLLPGESFVYNFVADAPGTYWGHSHYKAQEVDGMRFAIVVNDPASASGRVNPPLYYAQGVGNVLSDQIVTLADLYHNMSAVLVQWYLSPASGGNEPVPQTGMIDGIAQTPGCNLIQGDPNACTFARVAAGPSPVACPSSGSEQPGVTSDFATLLRIVNMAGMAAFRFSVDGHRMRIVGADATPIDEPELVRSIVINDAQRYNVLLCRDPPVGGGQPAQTPAWIRAEIYPGVFYKEPEYPLVLGVLYYGQDDGSLPPEPILPRPEMLPAYDPFVKAVPPAVLNPQRLTVAGILPAPPPATRTVRLALNFEIIKQDTTYAVFNNISFTFTPATPSLMERYLGQPPGPPPRPDNRNGATFGFNVIDVNVGDVVDIIIENFDTGEHPIHLHGLVGFWVMRYGAPNDGLYAPGKGYAGRVVRDTETVNLKSFIVLRYVATGKGTLFIMHCHISFHLSAGLATVMRTV